MVMDESALQSIDQSTNQPTCCPSYYLGLLLALRIVTSSRKSTVPPAPLSPIYSVYEISKKILAFLENQPPSFLASTTDEILVGSSDNFNFSNLISQDPKKSSIPKSSSITLT
mmetsp:Transcript_27538/g.38751  ORF Transcript_27538/g.38751 Transcript_27538/m.38751 type:complete len:113 (+) Transcript_27538:343-681(+)